MHKFTIFTIIFSIIIVFVVANLIITDFRDKIDDKQKKETVLVMDDALKDPVISPPPSEKIKVDIVSDNEDIDNEKEPDKKEIKVLNADYWQKLGLNEESDVAFREYNERIFTILSPNNNGTLKVYKNFIKNGEFEGIEIYEIIMADKESAEKNYEEMLQIGQKSILFAANPTNDFGNQSFYLNDELKNDSVFLIILKENVIYALAYPKGKHQSLLNLIKDLP